MPMIKIVTTLTSGTVIIRTTLNSLESVKAEIKGQGHWSSFLPCADYNFQPTNTIYINHTNLHLRIVVIDGKVFGTAHRDASGWVWKGVADDSA